MSWVELLQDFAKHFHWRPADVLDGHTFAEFWLLWCGGGNRRAEHSRDAVRAKIDRLRAAKGLPPSSGWPEG